jgi:hypothetical protein
MPAPTPNEVKEYLGQTSASIETIGAALAAELRTQRRLCRVPADPAAAWDPDLTEAACRRVARNLAMRGIPLAMFQGDADGGSLVPPNRDPEIRRLEGPLRKMKFG